MMLKLPELEIFHASQAIYISNKKKNIRFLRRPRNRRRPYKKVQLMSERKPKRSTFRQKGRKLKGQH